MQEKADARRKEAEEIISARLQDSYVHAGHAQSRYGHPDADGNRTDGGKMVYVDGSGSRILPGANNIKDAVVVAYIIKDANFDEDKAARDDLIINVRQMMNPDIVKEESDIYSCPNGCDSFSYHCDSESDLAAISSYAADGVQFYGGIET